MKRLRDKRQREGKKERKTEVGERVKESESERE